MSERPVTYRAEVIGPLLQSVAAGECCSVIGISGVGKSNLLQQLQRPAVLSHFLGPAAADLRVVTIDANLMADWSPWGYFEGLSEALLVTLGAELPPEALETAQAHQRQLLGSVGNHALALRHCSALIAQLCAQFRLVLLFDEFDPIFAQLAGAVVRNLRGLRDRHKYRLMFVTISRQPLAGLRDEREWDVIEPFVELLSLRELGLGPLVHDDAVHEVVHFAGRHQRTVAAEQQQQIVALSGGHPALIRGLTQLALLAPGGALRSLDLHQEPSIRLECAKICQQLTPEEQDDLLPIAYGNAYDPRWVRHLLLKGLVQPRQDGVLSVFSPLLRDYLVSLGQAPAGSAPPVIWMDPQRNAIHYYGRDVRSAIPPLAYRLLAYLWERPGQICDPISVAEAVYPGEQQIDLEPLRLVARRLRARLEELAPEQWVPFRIHHGQGYQLIVDIGQGA